MKVVALNASRGRMSYEEYRRNRDAAVKRETIEGWIGPVQEQEYAARYHAEVRAWLASAELTAKIAELQPMCGGFVVEWP